MLVGHGRAAELQFVNLRVADLGTPGAASAGCALAFALETQLGENGRRDDVMAASVEDEVILTPVDRRRGWRPLQRGDCGPSV